MRMDGFYSWPRITPAPRKMVRYNWIIWVGMGKFEYVTGNGVKGLNAGPWKRKMWGRMLPSCKGYHEIYPGVYWRRRLVRGKP